MNAVETEACRLVCPLTLGRAQHEACLGALCMAWNWLEDDWKVVYAGVNEAPPENGVRDDFIKRADIDADLPTGQIAYRVPNTERRGTCGLIQWAQVWHNQHPPRPKALK